MPPLRIDILQMDVFDTVVAADNLGTLGYLRAQVLADDIVYPDVGIATLGVGKQSGQCRTIGIQVGTGEMVILILAHLHARPTVVDTAEDQQDVR